MTKIKKYLNIGIIFTNLVTISLIAQGEENLPTKDAIFQQVFNDEKQRIMSLTAYEEGHNRYMQFLNDIEQYKAEKIKELQQDLKYQKNVAIIKEEIQKSGTLQINNLSNIECAHLVNQLSNQFFSQ